MPRPATPESLVHSPKAHFPYGNWQADLRTYQYFRVFGYNHFRLKANLFDNSVIENEDVVAEAKKIVEKQWKKDLPPTSPNKDDVGLIGVNQIRRVRRGRHVSFQTACVAVVALELAIAKCGSKIDIYAESPDDPDVIAICPTLFAVNNYEKVFYDSHIAENAANYGEVIKATGQSRNVAKGRNVFEDMAEGKLVTEVLAKRFVDHWSGRLASYAICTPRMGHKFWEKSMLENEVFPLA